MSTFYAKKWLNLLRGKLSNLIHVILINMSQDLDPISVRRSKVTEDHQEILNVYQRYRRLLECTRSRYCDDYSEAANTKMSVKLSTKLMTCTLVRLTFLVICITRYAIHVCCSFFSKSRIVKIAFKTLVRF